jgi:tetratricopeptide (TPR) repeat protein/TolB-like protein
LLRLLTGFILLMSSLAPAQAHSTKLVLILPFQNDSKAPGLEWVGESFPEVMGQALSKSRLFVVSRNERLYAFDKLGVPTSVQLSHATLLRIAQEMDVDFIITGSYGYDGRTFSLRAQIMDMSRLRLSEPAAEAGAITQTVDIQTALAADLSRDLERMGGPPAIRATSPSIRLDALENYIKGVSAASLADRIKFLTQAVRLAPLNFKAVLALGKAHFDNKDYQQASAWLAKVPKTEPMADEANFFLGLAAYYLGDYPSAEDAFTFTAQQLPLVEVTNNLGVVAARRGASALEFFEQAVRSDPRDPDYHVNYAIALYRSGDAARAAKELKDAISLRPQDTEAVAFLRSLALPSAVQFQLPAERLKRTYNEASYRQLAIEIQSVNEMRYSAMPPPQHAAAHVTRGNELLAQELLDQAESEFREAILVDPPNALAHAGLADILERRGDLNTARSEANTANTYALSTQAFLVLARIEQRQQRPANALDYVERALKIEPTNAAALDMERRLRSQQP